MLINMLLNPRSVIITLFFGLMMVAYALTIMPQKPIRLRRLVFDEKQDNSEDVIAHIERKNQNFEISKWEKNWMRENPKGPEVFQGECKSKPAYVFLKKHKTASTTFRQLMSHYTRNKGLDGENQLIGPQGGCYPARFNERCWPVDGHRDPLQVLSYHFRWNADYLPKVLQTGTAVITTIREPLSTFRSVYNYFYYERPTERDAQCDMPCWKEPFLSMTGGKEKVPIEEFLDMLPKVFDPTQTRNFRTKNYQAFEMGLDHLNDDEEYIKHELKRLDNQFDLVILTEYFFESLVLLAHVLCVDYDVLYITSKNSRKYEVEPLNAHRMEIFKTYFKQDYMLYQYFNESLHAKAEAFGQERMKEELIKIKALYKKCDKESCDEVKMFPHAPKNTTDSSRAPFQKLKASEYLQIMDENYGACNNPGNPYHNVKTWVETGELNEECGTGKDIRRNIEMN